ncbi:CRISPR-associated endonuclease Cas2 [Desulfurobacterium atlanticum]|uniref:CRISPR-associated endoribonuclease Cas2 n=1 Tax=Desulfurobacterium atlanticum TaxID=240169 RepID=A0A238XW04_9BACT|nr:CRISPR-associated endonuclease Cas2 [Desulfurobacterium atlanticum]SNR63097.1 CRISPR-associated protein, Cas2 family [Desulfurobacterium atlanticum]
MKYLVVYDISDDKIRNKVSTRLKKFGMRVQYSAFEIEIKKTDYIKLYKEIASIIDKTDSVFFFPLSSYSESLILKLGQVKREEDVI